MPLLELRESGLFYAPGNFYVDPWSPVDRAVITHAHPEHAIAGCAAYLTAAPGEALLRERIGESADVQALAYGECVDLGGVRISLHPAGHMLGSAQVRIEYGGEIWVVSGDYKLDADPTCTPFEPLRCHTFLTEATFGLPIFRWPADSIDILQAWWRTNQGNGKASLLFTHAMGMAQRILAQIDPAIGPIFAHEEIERINGIYRQQGITLPKSVEKPDARALILAPMSAHGSAWAKSFGSVSTAMATGWMRIRGPRRRRSLDRGFVISDHADWPGLLRAIDATGADTIAVTHGFRAPLVRWLEEKGKHAAAIEARWEEAES